MSDKIIKVSNEIETGGDFGAQLAKEMQQAIEKPKRSRKRSIRLVTTKEKIQNRASATMTFTF